MVVAFAVNASPSLCLLLVEHGEDAEDDGDARIQLNPHQAVHGGIRDVLKVHRLSLDEDADGDDGVKRARGAVGEGGQVGGGRGEQVRCGGGAGGVGLDLGGGDEAEEEGS